VFTGSAKAYEVGRSSIRLSKSYSSLSLAQYSRSKQENTKSDRNSVPLIEMDFCYDHWPTKPPCATSISGTGIIIMYLSICILLCSEFTHVYRPPGVLHRRDSTVMWNTIISLEDGIHVRMHRFVYINVSLFQVPQTSKVSI